jgi:hypothetical protein
MMTPNVGKPTAVHLHPLSSGSGAVGPHWARYMRRMCITGEETLMDPFLSTAVIADPFVRHAPPGRS